MANRFCVSLTHAKDNQDKATVGFVVAAVGGAAGAVLWFTAPKEAAQNKPGTFRTAGVSWQPYVGTTGGGVMGRF